MPAIDPPPPPTEKHLQECIDKVDNDKDGLIDAQDPDCAWMREDTYGRCNDTADNDRDGLIDAADPDCANVQPPPPNPQHGPHRLDL